MRRAVRTRDYLYIHNFEAERWPAGSPDREVCARRLPFGEVDRSPTKTFMMENRSRQGVARLAELAFGIRPAEELYDLTRDPHQLNNVAGQLGKEALQRRMREKLFQHLAKTEDPRVVGGKVLWDHYPYYGYVHPETRNWKVDSRPER